VIHYASVQIGSLRILCVMLVTFDGGRVPSMTLSPASAELVYLGEASSSLQGTFRTSFDISFNYSRCRLIANCIA
jgi:hypothetical protein